MIIFTYSIASSQTTKSATILIIANTLQSVGVCKMLFNIDSLLAAAAAAAAAASALDVAAASDAIRNDDVADAASIIGNACNDDDDGRAAT